MDLEYVTHASLLVRGAHASLLVDPFFALSEEERMALDHYPARHIEAGQWGAIDFLFSSHVHPDHSHAESLRRLRPHVRDALIPAERPELAARYRAQGYGDPRELRRGVRTWIAPDFHVTSFWSDAVDSLLVVECDGQVVVHQNDCELDAAAIAEVADRFPRIDVACLLYTKAQSLFPLVLPRDPEELRALVAEREEALLQHQAGCVRAWRPRRVLPYSMTMTYVQPDQWPLNGWGRLTPPTFVERMRRLAPGPDYVVLLPGDVMRPDGSVDRGRATEGAWGRDADEYLDGIARHFSRFPPPRFKAGSVRSLRPRLDAFLEWRAGQPFSEGLIARPIDIVVWGEDEEVAFRIDPAERSLLRPTGDDRRDTLRIRMPSIVAERLLSGVDDPYAALYSYRVEFGGAAASKGPPLEAFGLVIRTFLELFAGVERARGLTRILSEEVPA